VSIVCGRVRFYLQFSIIVVTITFLLITCSLGTTKKGIGPTYASKVSEQVVNDF
jgi:hypothetical protein